MDKEKLIELKKALDGLDAEDSKDAKITELEAKVTKLESAPATQSKIVKGSGIEVGAPDKYKGFYFKRQGLDQPNLFPSDEKAKNLIIKEVLDIFAKESKDPSIRKAAMQEGSASEGLEFVPEQWMMNVEEKARLSSIALAECRRFPMAGNVLHIPKAGTSVTVTWANEESASSQSEPGSGTVQLTAKRVGLWGVFSRELLDDSLNDIVSYITRDVVEAFGQEIDDQVFNGDQFEGILDHATYRVRFGTNNGTSINDVIAQNFYDAIYTLHSIHRVGAKFYLCKELMPYIQTLTTGTGGVPLMSYLGGVQAATIAGYPFVEVSKIDGTDSTAANYVAFGSLQNYALGARLIANSLELNPYDITHFTQYQVAYRFYARLAGKPIWENMYVRMGTGA